MTVRTLSTKNQTPLLEPVGDAESAYGALKPKRAFVLVEEETAGIESAVGEEIGRGLVEGVQRCEPEG